MSWEVWGRKHTLEFGLAQRRGVAGDEHELGLALAESLQGRLVTEGDCERARGQLCSRS